MSAHAPLVPGPLARLYRRLGEAAVAWSSRPAAAVGGLLALNLGCAAVLAPAGYAVTGDRAEFFRELMPGTWLSFAELVLVSAIAWEAHRRSRTSGTGASGGPAPRAADRGLRRYDDFWALSAGVFAVLAVDELTQATLFLGKWLGSALELAAPEPFVDIDAVLLVLLFAVCAIVLARRASVLARHPRALALLLVAGALGVASQALDSLVPASEWETVAEDTLKLLALPFFVGGYLTALGELLSGPEGARRPRRASRAQGRTD